MEDRFLQSHMHKEKFKRIKQDVKQKYKNKANEFWMNTCTYINQNVGYSRSKHS